VGTGQSNVRSRVPMSGRGSLLCDDVAPCSVIEPAHASVLASESNRESSCSPVSSLNLTHQSGFSVRLLMRMGYQKDVDVRMGHTNHHVSGRVHGWSNLLPVHPLARVSLVQQGGAVLGIRSRRLFLIAG
jgi:hypothetical protein